MDDFPAPVAQPAHRRGPRVRSPAAPKDGAKIAELESTVSELVGRLQTLSSASARARQADQVLETPHLPCVSAAFVAEIEPLPCVSAAFVVPPRQPCGLKAATAFASNSVVCFSKAC